jgi:hypothetical protein
VILETCHHINDARVLVAANVKFARTTEEIGYWSKVQVLVSRQNLMLTSAPHQARKVRSKALLGESIAAKEELSC